MKQFILLIFPLFFFIACGSDSEQGQVPQNCFAGGNHYNCQDHYYYNGQQYPYTTNYPYGNNGYYYGYQGSAFNNVAQCPSGTMPVANPSYGLDCVPQGNGNYHYVQFQNYNLPQGCRIDSQCPSSYCVNNGPHTPGYCSR